MSTRPNVQPGKEDGKAGAKKVEISADPRTWIAAIQEGFSGMGSWFKSLGSYFTEKSKTPVLRRKVVSAAYNATSWQMIEAFQAQDITRWMISNEGSEDVQIAFVEKPSDDYITITAHSALSSTTKPDRIYARRTATSSQGPTITLMSWKGTSVANNDLYQHIPISGTSLFESPAITTVTLTGTNPDIIGSIALKSRSKIYRVHVARNSADWAYATNIYTAGTYFVEFFSKTPTTSDPHDNIYTVYYDYLLTPAVATSGGKLTDYFFIGGYPYMNRESTEVDYIYYRIGATGAAGANDEQFDVIIEGEELV